MAGCCVFLRWPSASPPRIGYRPLDAAGAPPSPATVTVVVGKERRAFAVDRLVLDSYPFRLLLETVAHKEDRRGGGGGGAIFVDIDAILFEHILWLACDARSISQILHLDLKEIIDFYAQDA
ncbi:auxin-responsive protein SAUR76-like [Miscanthus floridulus]|uniref:auxin-responsive protein SAUR76-like n=1 Tax=Miscanthus floridulus TaxID=154761 RepID=UPI00345967B3